MTTSWATSQHKHALGCQLAAIALSACLLSLLPGTAHAAVQTARLTAGSAAATSGSGAHLRVDTYTSRLRVWANRARARHGVAGLRRNDCLQRRADRWATHLASKNSFYHQDMGSLLSRCSLSGAGEILAKGAVTPRRMVRMWLNSSEHRQILLSRFFRIAGVSAHQGSGGAWVGCIDVGRR